MIFFATQFSNTYSIYFVKILKPSKIQPLHSPEIRPYREMCNYIIEVWMILRSGDGYLEHLFVIKVSFILILNNHVKFASLKPAPGLSQVVIEPSLKVHT